MINTFYGFNFKFNLKKWNIIKTHNFTIKNRILQIMFKTLKWISIFQIFGGNKIDYVIKKI